MSNRLKDATSPYLLQHSENPVDWYPWGSEALGRAAKEDKPIFLSIGYAACHWCHVMEHHVFEDAKIAELLRAGFIAIKVDREERPDIDAQYMLASQILTGGGGWPLSAFLTPELKPVFAAGRYFDAAQFTALIGNVARLWKERRADLIADAERISDAIREVARARRPGLVGPGLMDKYVSQMAPRYDPKHGGFGGAPKFPSVPGLWPLLGSEMLDGTLKAMARGGIHDHVGGGFFRYSTDERWLVPHFEKMLYDQGQLASIYAAAFALNPDPDYRAAALGIGEFVRRELTDKGGGFYSSLDADSEGEEGKFYVFAVDEIRAALGAEAQRFSELYGILERGNFEDSNVLSLVDPQSPVGALPDQRQRLFDARSKRVRPATDDKVLSGWNGLMIEGLARVGRVFADEASTEAARRAANFVLGTMRPDGVLRRSYRNGKLSGPGYLSDYAFVINGLLELPTQAGAGDYLSAAVSLAEKMVEPLWDPIGGGFFDSEESPDLLGRMKSGEDGAEPSGNGAAARALLRLAEATGDSKWRDLAGATVRAFGGLIEAHPAAFPNLVIAAHDLQQETAEVRVSLEGSSVVIDIPEGWHIATHGDGQTMGLNISIESPGATATPDYPAGEYDETLDRQVYRGRVVVPIGIDKDAAVAITVRYQPCTEFSCLIPQTMYLP